MEPTVTPVGPLRPVEQATAAVMGGLTALLAVVGWLLPHASALQSLGAVPMGVVAHRHRPRAVVAAAVAAGVVSFLCAGTGPLFSVITAAVVGGLVGDVKRRGRGIGALVAASLVAGPLLAALTDGLLLVFANSRRLTLRQLRDLFHGLAGIVGQVPALSGASSAIDSWVATALRWWWLTVGVVVLLSFAIGLWAAWVILGGVLDRMRWMHGEDRLDDAPPDGAADMPPAPVPVRLVGVGHRYPGVEEPALAGVDLAIGEPALVALVGTNGSGKSTLARILAGARPSEGVVERAGPAGLGLAGRTALVAQRPETQVLGVRVADDVTWGLPPGGPATAAPGGGHGPGGAGGAAGGGVGVDVEGLLATVGLGGMGARETSTLSGGELQRLALAAALARRPSLVVSDESTAMIDPEGRARMVRLLAGLPERGTAVVHVTHRADEATAADRVVQLRDGRIVEGEVEALLGAGPEGRSAAVRLPPAGGAGRPPIVVVEGVGHTYGRGTPWAQPALVGVDLVIGEGDGILVVGDNGSGKSTLAWVLAGLLRPDEGTCRLDGRPVAAQVGAVGLAFQMARLQLQRPTVGADIRAASGISRDDVTAALGRVGLDASIARRGPDQLSGGQQRRVAIAGLLARRPRMLVLDEPLAGLDPPGRRALLDVLVGLRADGLTVVVISHDLEGMEDVCDRTVRLRHGRVVTDAEDPGVLDAEAVAP